MELKRYVVPMRPDQLSSVVVDSNVLQTELIGTVPDLERLQEVLSDRHFSPGDDAWAATEIHRVFKDLDSRAMTDMAMWHWLTTVPFKDYVNSRWKIDGENLNTHAKQQRFLGGTALVGVSRNALARLYWCAEKLWTIEDGYQHSDLVLANQDLFTSIFERKLGLHAPLARELVNQCAGFPEDIRRAWIKTTNHVLTTVAVEVLNSDQLTEFVDSCRP